MKGFLVILTALLGLGVFNSSAATHLEIMEYNKASDLGMQAIRSKNYDKAYKNLLKASELGNKASQFSLALLYIQGSGVEQDYTKAYLWLNVAAEVKERKWRNMRDKIHNALSQEQKAALKPHVEDYIAKYGSEKQDVSCYKKAATGSNRKLMTCIKQLDKQLKNF